MSKDEDAQEKYFSYMSHKTACAASMPLVHHADSSQLLGYLPSYSTWIVTVKIFNSCASSKPVGRCAAPVTLPSEKLWGDHKSRQWLL